MVYGARELRLLDGGDQPQLIAGNLRFALLVGYFTCRKSAPLR
jgi:hypothetical protein